MENSKAIINGALETFKGYSEYDPRKQRNIFVQQSGSTELTGNPWRDAPRLRELFDYCAQQLITNLKEYGYGKIGGAGQGKQFFEIEYKESGAGFTMPIVYEGFNMFLEVILHNDHQVEEIQVKLSYKDIVNTEEMEKNAIEPLYAEDYEMLMNKFWGNNPIQR